MSERRAVRRREEKSDGIGGRRSATRKSRRSARKNWSADDLLFASRSRSDERLALRTPYRSSAVSFDRRKAQLAFFETAPSFQNRISPAIRSEDTLDCRESSRDYIQPASIAGAASSNPQRNLDRFNGFQMTKARSLTLYSCVETTTYALVNHDRSASATSARSLCFALLSVPGEIRN